MSSKIAIRNIKPGMKFKIAVDNPFELNGYGVFKIAKHNKIRNRIFVKDDVMTVVRTIDNNQVEFVMDNGDQYIAFWSVFKKETEPMFDTDKVLKKNTVAYYLQTNEVSKLPFTVVKKEFRAQLSNNFHRIEYPVVLGVRYEYDMKSNFNLDIIKAYKTDENIAEFEEIILNKIVENWKEIQPLTSNVKNNTKIKLFTRRKKVIMEISELPHDLEDAIVEIKKLIQAYKNDSKTHIAIK